MTKLFLDGSAGTAGLRLRSRLTERRDIDLITLDGEDRKNPEKRREALNSCDVAMLCLPDAASREAVAMIENPAVRVVDTSTAHRTAEGWAYGFPELSAAHRSAIEAGAYVASPGCHAGGFIALVYPLVAAGLLPASAQLCCHSITGYSGGGKGMIAEYEGDNRAPALFSPRQYGLAQVHKHLPEMKKVSGLSFEPIFCPIVADFHSGMVVTVPLFASQLAGGAGIGDIKALYREKYNGPVVRYTESMDEAGFLASNSLAGLDAMEIAVFGNDERILLVSRFDNLGKGASGAALQCLNIMLGADEKEGLLL